MFLKNNKKSIISGNYKLVICVSIILGILFYSWLSNLSIVSIKDAIFSLYLRSSGAKLETLYLDIKHKDLQKLNYKCKKTLAPQNKGLMSILFSEPNDFVKAKIRYFNKSYPVKLRLKGDLADHLSEKRSFRVKLRKDNILFGLKKFSLHSPAARSYLYEAFYHYLLKREGLVSLKYFFVNVVVNGENLGVYALEEHFDKILIESNHYKEGPIIKIDENIKWVEHWKEELSKVDSSSLKPVTNIDYFLRKVSGVTAFELNKIKRNPVQYKYFINAKNLFNSFREGQLSTSQVFDQKKLARFLAVSQITGALHGLYNYNFRFYFNPVTKKLEPIGFDGTAGNFKTAKEILVCSEVSLKYLFFQDKVFFNIYKQELSRILDPNYLTTMLEDFQKSKKLNLKGDFFYELKPDLKLHSYFFSKGYLKYHQKKLLDFYENNKIYFDNSNERLLKFSLSKYNKKETKLAIKIKKLRYSLKELIKAVLSLGFLIISYFRI